MLGELGVMPDIVEAALNHVAIHSPLTATYNQSRYRPQVADALKRLADHFKTGWCRKGARTWLDGPGWLAGRVTVLLAFKALSCGSTTPSQIIRSN